MQITNNMINWLISNDDNFEMLYGRIDEKIEEHIKKTKNKEIVDYNFDIVNTDKKCDFKVTEKNNSAYLSVRKLTREEIQNLSDSLNCIASVQIKGKGLILNTQYYKFYLTKQEGSYILSTHFSRIPALSETILSEKVVDIHDLLENQTTNTTQI